MARVEASIDDESAAAEGSRRDGLWSPTKYRAGEQALTVLATPLNAMILRALAERPMRLGELRQATGLPAQTTLRGHLASLGRAGVLRKRPTAQMPYSVENELTPMGRELLVIAAVLDGWLGSAPGGPVSLESGAGKGIVRAFIDGWGSTIMRSLAATPMSLTELDRVIPDLSYPALERRLSSMRMAGLIEARVSRGPGTPYAVTDWTRRGVAPLVAASKCEHLHMRERAAPVTQADIEAAFLLVTPMIGLPPGVNGACQLEVAADPALLRPQAGVNVTVERGTVVACDSPLAPSPGDFAVGSVTAWFSAVQDGAVNLLRFGGDRRLPEAVALGLHAVLVS